jgi:hypothetical protein
MKKALIFHGTHGSPQGNWFPWLQEELMMKGWQVAVPKLPTPEGQSLMGWIEALEEQVPAYQDADVVYGHSCGGAFALRLLEQGLITPEKVILVGTVIDFGNQFDDLNKTFVEAPFDWQKIKTSCDNAVVFHGDNDPYVSMKQAETISENLNAPLHVIKDGGHLNADAGFTEFPALLNCVDD